jgi:hypothetical protein
VYAAGGELPFHVAQWTPRLGLLVPFIRQRARETLAARIVVEVGGEARGASPGDDDCRDGYHADGP